MFDPKIIELKKMYDFESYLTNNNGTNLLYEFIHNLHFENRFFNDNHPIFDHIKKLFEEHTIELNLNELLFRARKVQNEDCYKFCTEEYFEENFYGYNKKDSFISMNENIQANRANPNGIPCLYVAKDEKTAIAEVRPFLGNEISVAIIQLTHNLKLFDLFFDHNMPYNKINLAPAYIWFGLALAFSIPYEKTSQNDYLLTQCISEYIKKSGFDGIQYSSSFNEGGKNIALFNCKHEDDGGKYEICEPIGSHCCIVKRIEYNFEFFN